MSVINILTDLIKIDTTNPPGNEKRITDYIIDRYKGYEDIVRIENGENRESLIINIAGETDEKIAFVGHIDTVSVSDPSLWKYPPFDAYIEGDTMYGRGASDMKSGVACMISLGDYFINNNIKPNKNIMLVFTSDEEVGGKGVLSIFEKGYLDDVDFIVMPENTSSDIVLKEKGALWISLELFGRSAHGSNPDLGINSIEIVYEIVERLKFHIENYFTDDLLGDSTISLNKIVGGESTNIIPDYCRAEIDIRGNPDFNNEEIIDYLKKQINILEYKYEGLRIEHEILTNRPSLETSSDNKYLNEFKSNLEELGMNYDYAGVTYFTDLSLIIPKMKKPFVIFGPGHIEGGHQVNECVSIEATKKVRDLFIKYMK